MENLALNIQRRVSEPEDRTLEITQSEQKMTIINQSINQSTNQSINQY